MVFSFSPKDRKEFSLLTEQDIRNKLYGSAVGTCADTARRPVKKHKDNNNKILLQESTDGQDLFKIRDELALLRSELEQARKRLKKLKNINAKKIRLAFIYVIISFLVVYFMYFAVKKIFSYNPAKAIPAKTAVPVIARQAVQIAVFDKLADAQRLQSGLKAKGYSPFIHKSSFLSGKDKFTVYMGAFQDKASAQNLIDTLKAQEGIKDAFISNMPE
jgi:hypothetical protein